MTTLTRDEWALLRRACSPLTIAELLTDFDRTRKRCVEGMHGGTWTPIDGASYETERTGLHVLGPYPTELPGATTMAEWKQWQKDHPRPIIIDLPWRRIRDWARAQRHADVEQARAHSRQWGTICKLRASYWDPADQCGPGWAECRTHPLTWRASVELEAQEREHTWRDGLRAWVETLAPGDEPTDLLELLAVS